jgi:hypothetical protein
MTERETEREIERRMRSGDVLALAKASFWRALAGMFTQSLDSALTLVPEGWGWRRRSNLTMALVYGESEKYDLVAVHHEPCRALIAACLKARMEALGE